MPAMLSFPTVPLSMTPPSWISYKGDDAAFDEVHMFDRGIRLDQHLLVVEPHAFHRRSEPLAICAGESRKNLVSIRHWAFRGVSNVCYSSNVCSRT